jgi:hypothetical protein
MEKYLKDYLTNDFYGILFLVFHLSKKTPNMTFHLSLSLFSSVQINENTTTTSGTSQDKSGTRQDKDTDRIQKRWSSKTKTWGRIQFNRHDRHF